MDACDLMLCVVTLLALVMPSSSSYCYYSYSTGYYCNYYSVNYYYDYGSYWGTARTVGAAVGGGISLIITIVVIIIFCRICRGRRASQGTTFTTGQPITTVTNGTASQPYNMSYYPQQPGQQAQYPYGQPVQQTPQYPYDQPVQQTQNPYLQPQQPMGGYPNMAYNPPSYDQAADLTKPTVTANAPTA